MLLARSLFTKKKLQSKAITYGLRQDLLQKLLS